MSKEKNRTMNINNNSDYKAMRRTSRQNLKRNYIACVTVCFLLMIFGAEYASSDGLLGEHSDLGVSGGSTGVSSHMVKGSQLGNAFFDSLLEEIDNEQLKTATKGVMASLANSLTKTAHVLTFAGDAVRHILANHPVMSFLVSLLGVIASLLYYMFFQVQLKIGQRRFFLENRIYRDTRATRIFSVYRTSGVRNVAKIMVLRAVLNLLWCLTIVGGIMKYYEYRTIPYILAENPMLSRKDCFALAKELSMGYKMQMFRFDLTYLLWFIAGFFTMGLLNILYTNPYYRGGQAEFHVMLRERAKAAGTPHIHLLDDAPLYEHRGEARRADLYPSIKIRAKHELSVPWDRHYSIIHIGLIFFAFAMIGWCWEVLYHFILDGILINRGSLWGPWIPIYGVGGTCVVVLLKPLGKKPALMAVCTFFACGIIEYFTSWYFETFDHIKYWDYSNYLFNINGRVCLEGLIMFTILASLGLYMIAPRFDNLFSKWPAKVKVPLLCFLTTAFLGDVIYTHFHPHTGKGISSGLIDFDLPDYQEADVQEVSHV